jgi:hypothetical protein
MWAVTNLTLANLLIAQFNSTYVRKQAVSDRHWK